MSCENVIDFLTRETGRFSEEIYNRIVYRTPWIGLIRKDAFPSGMGETISNLTYERSLPTSAEPTWSAVSTASYDDNPSGVEGGACLPTPTKIAIASTVRTWSLKRRALEGPDFCAEELRTPFAVAAQMNRIQGVLADYAAVEWEIRYRHEYLRLVGKKVVVSNTSGGETEGTGESFPASCPGGKLNQAHLNKYKLKLRRDGAFGSAMGRMDGAPVLTLICSAETSDDLIRDNADIRQDIRDAQPSELLKPYGVERVYRGFFHLIDDYPIRYTCSGGTYTEVAAWTTSAATKGNKAAINSSWEAAPYEVSFIYDPTVFTSRIPRPVTNVSGVRFNPVNYSGMFMLKNIPDRVCNPDGNIVFHRAILAQASEPVHPERGVAFAHLRCDPSQTVITSCS